MPKDDLFLGTSAFNKIHWPGNDIQDDTPTQNINDSTLQREQAANTFLRGLGVPWVNRRYVAVYVNGRRRGILMEDALRPTVSVPDEYFPEDTGGLLYKIQPWFEFGPTPSGTYMPWANESWAYLMPYTTTGGAYKSGRYRWNYETRQTPDSLSNYTNLFSLITAASAYNSPNYVSLMGSMADMENWLRVFAANHAAGNWDAYGAQNSQNLYGYMGTHGTKYSLLMFDFNIVFGNSGSWGPGENLFTGNFQDPNTLRIYNEPRFRRMYWRALQELMNGPFDVTKSGPLLDAKYDVFAMNGINAENPDTFAPSPGLIGEWVLPGGYGVRVDTHAGAGYRVPPYYDSMIAKLIVHGRDRAEAIARMERALEFFVVEGIRTTIPLHREILRDPVYRSGRLSTRFMEGFQARRDKAAEGE